MTDATVTVAVAVAGDDVLALCPDISGSLFLRGLVRDRRGDKVGSAVDLAAARLTDPTTQEEYARIGTKP